MAGSKRKIPINNTQPSEKKTSKKTQKAEEKIENRGGIEEEEKPKKLNKRATLYTHDGQPLTENESRFIEEYLVHGNAKQAFETAYPNAKTKNTASEARKVLNKSHVIGEINYRLELAKQESIATASEIMNYFSAVMRGEIKDAFGLEAPLSERTKAAIELAKRQIDIPQRLADNRPPELKITLDWGGTTVEENKTPTVSEVLGINTESLLKQLNGDVQNDTGDE